MIRPLRFGTLAVLMACVVLATVNPVRGDDEEEKRKMEAAEKLAKIKKAGAALDQYLQGKLTAAEVAKTHTMEFVMYTFKPNAKGGLGPGDGYEVRIRQIAARGKTELTAERLRAEAADLVRMGQVAKAITEILDASPEWQRRLAGLRPGPGPVAKEVREDAAALLKQFEQGAKEMKEAAAALPAAVKSMKPEEVQRVIRALHQSCVTCHRRYESRD